MNIFSLLFGYKKNTRKKAVATKQNNPHLYHFRVSFLPVGQEYTLTERFYADSVESAKNQLNSLYPYGFTNFKVIQKTKQI